MRHYIRCIFQKTQTTKKVRSAYAPNRITFLLRMSRLIGCQRRSGALWRPSRGRKGCFPVRLGGVSWDVSQFRHPVGRNVCEAGPEPVSAPQRRRRIYGRNMDKRENNICILHNKSRVFLNSFYA